MSVVHIRQMEVIIFLIIFDSVLSIPVRKSRIPLKDHMNVPLFAELDMQSTNAQLEHFILSEVENAINDTTRQIIDKFIEPELGKIIESEREMDEVMKYELAKLRSELFLNYSAELEFIKENFEKRFHALETMSQCNKTEQSSITGNESQVQAKLDDKQKMKDSTGEDFYLAFLQSHGRNGNLYIYIVSNSSSTCQVNIPFNNTNTTVAISETAVNTVKLNSDICLNNHGLQRKSIHVKCNIPVSIYGVSFLGRENDGFLAIPTPYLGRNYIISSFKILHRSSPHSNSHFGIICIYDNSNVTIKFRTTSGSITYNKKRYKNNDILHIQLNKMDTFYLSHYHDMSGTIISASKPIAVLSGLRTSYLRNGWGNHMTEMILPNDQLGRSFVVPTLYDSQCDFRILGQSSTTFRLYHQKMATHVNIPEQSFIDYSKYTVSTVNSSGHVQVELYCNGLHSYYDAFMVTLPSIQHFKSYYRFPVVNNFNDERNLSERFHITVIIQANVIDGLRLDNDQPHFNTVSNVTLNDHVYSVLSANVSVGLHTAAHQHNIPFGLLVYGRSQVAGYGYPAGFALQNKINN